MLGLESWWYPTSLYQSEFNVAISRTGGRICDLAHAHWLSEKRLWRCFTSWKPQCSQFLLSTFLGPQILVTFFFFLAMLVLEQQQQQSVCKVPRAGCGFMGESSSQVIWLCHMCLSISIQRCMCHIFQDYFTLFVWQGGCSPAQWESPSLGWITIYLACGLFHSLLVPSRGGCYKEIL